MSAEPDTPAARDNEFRPRLLTKLGVTILVVVTIAMTLLVAENVFVFRYLGAAKADKARLDMKTLETAYKSAVSASKQKQPSYPADIIPFLEQGSAGLIDPWDKQYQMRIIQTGDGPRPQFFTFAPDGQEIVWPRQ